MMSQNGRHSQQPSSRHSQQSGEQTPQPGSRQSQQYGEQTPQPDSKQSQQYGEQTPQPDSKQSQTVREHNQRGSPTQQSAEPTNTRVHSRVSNQTQSQGRLTRATEQNLSNNGGSHNQESGMSNRSPAPPISRTPSADRRLLRALTVSPNQDDIADATPEPEYTPRQSTRQSTQGRVTKQSVARSPTVTPSNQGTPNRTPSVTSRVSEAGGGNATTIQLPSTPATEIRTDAWQSNKTVGEANNYMLKYEVASDVTFTVGEAQEDIRAHKYMLMARSPVLFKSLIKHLGNNDIRISVPDITPNNFRDLLQYIYTDEFDIHTDNVTFMLYAAKKFQLTGLSKLSFQYLDAEMHDETVTRIMEQAHIYNESNLYEKCVRYIFANGNSVLRKLSISELCTECLTRIIKSDDLRAEEEAVFEGCMVWANAECRRQKKQPTDEARRKVLGKLLYLIRFPVMDVTYFTQKVSLGKLLSHDETLSIFQYFHGEEQQLPNRFSRHERNRMPRNITENVEPVMLTSQTSRSPSTSRVHRFTTTDGQWKQNGPPDAISFTVSQPIVLYGVEIYGVAFGKETYALKILVYDDITREEIRKNDASVFTNNIKDTYEVYLTRPLRIPPRRVFTIVVIMRGSPSHKGVDGEKVHIVDGVTFEFSDSNRSSNGTDSTVGQLPGLLFNKTQ